MFPVIMELTGMSQTDPILEPVKIQLTSSHPASLTVTCPTHPNFLYEVTL